MMNRSDGAERKRPGGARADVHMVLTRNMNAKRLARMVLKPVIAGVSAVLFDYRTDSQAYSASFPELAGTPFRDVPFVFDMATVLGVFPAKSNNELVIRPPQDYVMTVRALGCACGASSAGPASAVSSW